MGKNTKVQHAYKNKSVRQVYMLGSHSRLTVIINKLKFSGLAIQVLALAHAQVT